jgi:hypothetical protein
MPREPLPERRRSETLDFNFAGKLQYRATLGYYDDGRLGEVFLNAGKVGTDVDVSTRDSAIALSFALQFGCTVDVIRAAMTRDGNGQPEGPLGVLLDLLAKEEGR